MGTLTLGTLQKEYKGLITGILTISSSLFLMSANSLAQTAPSSLEPSGYITDLAPQFTWSTVSGAQTYEFQLTDNSDSVVYFDQAGLSGPPFQIVGAVYDQTKAYHWKVRGLDATGTALDWSPIAAFVIYDPTLTPQATAPTGYITTVTPLFTWNSIAGASTYDLWILDQTETTTINMVGGLSQNTYQQPVDMPLSPYVIYHYRVRSHTSTGISSIWSDPSSFMMYVASDVPTLLAPLAQSPIQHTVFSWAPSATAVNFELILMNADETEVLLDASGLKDTSYILPGDVAVSVGLVYHWKVRSLLASGANSVWSSVASFALFDANTVPDALMPIGYVSSTNVILEWSQVNNATSYNIQIVEPITGNTIFTGSVYGDTRYALNSHMKVAQNLAYNWRIQAIVGGSPSVWSDMRSFKVTPTTYVGRIGQLKMTTQYSLSGTATSFSWQVLNLVGLNNLSYRVVLRSEPTVGMASTIWTGHTDPSDTSHLALPSSVVLSPKTNYAWIVQAFTADGTLIGESNRYNFLTPVSLSATALQQISTLQASQAAEVVTFQTSQATDMATLNEHLTTNNKLTAEQKASQVSALIARHNKAMAALSARHASKLQHSLNSLERAATAAAKVATKK